MRVWLGKEGGRGLRICLSLSVRVCVYALKHAGSAWVASRACACARVSAFSRCTSLMLNTFVTRARVFAPARKAENFLAYQLVGCVVFCVWACVFVRTHALVHPEVNRTYIQTSTYAQTFIQIVYLYNTACMGLYVSVAGLLYYKWIFSVFYCSRCLCVCVCVSLSVCMCILCLCNGLCGLRPYKDLSNISFFYTTKRKWLDFIHFPQRAHVALPCFTHIHTYTHAFFNVDISD